MKRDIAKDWIKAKDGYATKDGATYILVDRNTIPDPMGQGRAINGVAENAIQTSPGYFPMTLLRLPKGWKRGGEVSAAIPNGEYDWIMCEQKGYLTPPRGYCGARCHDC